MMPKERPCSFLSLMRVGLVLALPEGLRFWRAHPRIRTLPERAVEAAGRNAIVTSFHSVADRAGLDVVSARDSFAVIGVYETSGG